MINQVGLLVPDVQKVTLRKLSYFKWLAESLSNRGKSVGTSVHQASLICDLT